MNNESLPPVSIVMATYNGAKFLKEQMESLLHQTYSNIEIIIVDDGSTDNTREMLTQYAAQHKNIQLYFNDQHLGYVKNFEKGCGLANGNYISFSDQDDVWALNKTELLMEALDDSAIIYCDDELVDKSLHSLSKKHSDLKRLASFNNCLCFATDNCVGGHAMIIKKEILKFAYPFPEEMPYDLWCAFIATFHGGIKYLDKPLVKWRQHTNNITGLEKKKKEKTVETRKRLAIFYNTCPPELSMEKQVLQQLCKSYEDHSLQNNFLRMSIFLRYKKYLLAMKKRNEFRKFLFCLKMFYKLRLHVA